MGDKEWTPADLFDVFGDPVARRILVLASGTAVSEDDLAEDLDASDPTIYRRLNALSDYDLIRERQGIDPDGNHYRTFETTLRRASFEIEDSGVTVELEGRQSLAEQFETFLTDIETPRANPGDGDPAGEGVPHG